MSKLLALRAVIPTTSSAIRFAGREGEAGTVQLQFYGTGEEIE